MRLTLWWLWWLLQIANLACSMLVFDGINNAAAACAFGIHAWNAKLSVLGETQYHALLAHALPWWQLASSRLCSALSLPVVFDK